MKLRSTPFCTTTIHMLSVAEPFVKGQFLPFSTSALPSMWKCHWVVWGHIQAQPIVFYRLVQNAARHLRRSSAA
jgi:hypothetical protein